MMHTIFAEDGATILSQTEIPDTPAPVLDADAILASVEAMSDDDKAALRAALDVT